MEKSLARPPELAAAKKTSKTGLACLKPAPGFFFFFFLSNSLLLLFNFFFFSHFLPLFPSFLIYSFFLSLYISSSFLLFFFNSHNKTWNSENTRVGPKDGEAQQLRQWNQFHCCSRELASYCIFVLLFFHYSYINHFISIFVFLFFLFSLLGLTG